MRRPELADWAMVVLLSIIWGASFVNVRLALVSFGPLTVAMLRIAIAGLVLLAAARAMGQRLPGLRDAARWRAVLGMAIFSNALPFSLLAWGQQHVASGFAGMTMAAVPLFTLVLAVRFVPGEVLTPARLAGIALGAAGVVLLLGPRALVSSGADAEALARIACVAAAASYAVGGVVTRRAPPMPVVAKSAANLLVAALVMVPLALAVEGWPPVPSMASALSVLYLGVMPTALATLLLVAVIDRAGPTFLTLSNYQVPVWSLVFGWLAFGERLPAGFVLALALILAGIAVSGMRRGA